MDVTIREVEASDVPTLDILRRQSLEEAFRGVYDRSEFTDLVALSDDQLSTWIEDDSVVVQMVETEVTPVCYGAIDTETCTIEALYTSPDYLREGFATTLLERMCQEVACDTLTVVAPETATPFFEACGFEPFEKTEWNGLPGVKLQQTN